MPNEKFAATKKSNIDTSNKAQSPLTRESSEGLDLLKRKVLGEAESKPQEAAGIDVLTGDNAAQTVVENETGEGADAAASRSWIEESDLYPWETMACSDQDPIACKVFRPLCTINRINAFKYCRNTCGLCAKDNPRPHSKYSARR